MEIRKIPLDESLWLYKEPALLEAISPEAAMELACRVALKGAGAVHRNPLVGAVFVDKEHRFLAAAAHLAYGQEHAEIKLIEKIYKQGLEQRLDQCTLYTTLEPCSHVGKTQPCVGALSKLPIKNLIYGTIDPNPLVAGRGIAFLESRGIACTHSSVFEAMGAPLLQQFRWSLYNKTPFIGLKAALSLNGMAAFSGDRRAWITSERARRYGHWLRHCYEGILVGADTVICDNPSLNARHPHLRGQNPLKIILDPHGRALLSRPVREHRVIEHEGVKTLWISEERFWKSRDGSNARKDLEAFGSQILSLENTWNLHSLLQAFADKDLASLLLEGGTKVWASFLDAGFVNKCYFFLAPKIFNNSAMNLSQSLNSNLDLERLVLTQLDKDLLIEGELSHSGVSK